MSLLLASEIGRFRANPNADEKNNIKLVDPTTPGTPGTDTLASFDITSGPSVKIEGVRYVGKDGQEVFERFFKRDGLTREKSYYDLEFALTTAAEVEDAILNIIEQHEVDAKVSVSVSGDEWTFVHVGAGTLDDIVIDGSDESTTRT